MKKTTPNAFLRCTLIFLLSICARAGYGQQMFQYGFEAREPVWVPGPHDAGYRETLHQLAEDYIHSGQRSETIQLEAESGNYIHYTYTLGRAAVTDDLNVSLWVRANRPGVQLLARVVLPKERDPNNPGQPLTALLEGSRYQNVNHWQPLSLPSPTKLLQAQQQLLSNNLKRDIVTTDAYIDQLVLNVYSGPGQTRVWIDDLEAGPLLELPQPPAERATNREMTPIRPAVNQHVDEVRLEGGQLKVG